MKECPNCATEIPEDATVCRICKYEFGPRKVFPWKPVALLLLILFLLPVAMAVVRLLGH